MLCQIYQYISYIARYLAFKQNYQFMPLSFIEKKKKTIDKNASLTVDIFIGKFTEPSWNIYHHWRDAVADGVRPPPGTETDKACFWQNKIIDCFHSPFKQFFLSNNYNNLICYMKPRRLRQKMSSRQKQNKTIGYGGITEDFWVIKVHSFNRNFL